MAKIGFHKGLKANLPSTGLVEGHYYQCIDTGELYLATSATSKVLVANGSLHEYTAEEIDTLWDSIDGESNNT